MTSARAARSRAPPTTRRRSRRVERVPKINDVVDIWWAVDKTFYRGRLTTQLHNTTSFRILYDDGETEDLDLVNEHWKFARDDRTQPDADEIIDVVLDGSHHTSEQDPKTQAVSKKAKQKSTRPATTRLKSQQTSDDERDKDYVEETSTPEHPTRQRRSKADLEKPKKRLKKLRRYSTASDKTSTASRPPTRTASESRQADTRPEQPDTTSQVLTAEQSKADDQTRPREATSTEPKITAENGANHDEISREESDGPSKNRNVTQTAPSVKHTSSTVDKNTSHTPKSHAASKPTNSAPTQPRSSDSAVKTTAHQKSTPPQESGQIEKPANPKRVTSVQHNRIDNQRDLAIVQTVPSFLPPDTACLPSSSDPATSARHKVASDGTGTSIVPQNKASAPHTSAPSPAAEEPMNQDSSDIEMGDDVDIDEGSGNASVPVKVAIRPKNAQGDDVGSDGAARSRARLDSTNDHSGAARKANAASTRRETNLRKRSREIGQPSDETTAGDFDKETRQKRPKPTEVPGTPRGLVPSDGTNPLTHVPDHDLALTTLVNRRLNPIEKHLRSLADDVHHLTSETENQQKTSESLIDVVHGLEHGIRNEIKSIRDEIRSAQADRHEQQKEIVRLLQELKEDVAAVSRSRPNDYSAPASVPRGATANGYNVQSSRYQHNPVAPGPASSMRQVSDERTPPQGSRVARGRPTRMDVEEPGMNSDDDINLSPRRVAAPMSDSVRGPVEMNVNKVSHPPPDAKDRMVSLVARQITVWLLETPHEYYTRGNIPVAEWAKRTSANAFENVASRLSHFDNYVQAHQTLSTSLGNDAVEMSWFTHPNIRLNISRARRNYAAWDPPPTDSEWHCECILLAEVANAFHRALEAHIWASEDDLSAAVSITNEACASYGFRRDVSPRHPNSGIRVSMSQMHGSGHGSHHNASHYVRTSR